MMGSISTGRGEVCIVHCVDAEGPLHESLEATFERIRDIFGFRLAPTRETLLRLQRKEMDLHGKEDEVYRVVDPHLLNYHGTWERIDAMYDEITSPSFRNALPDSHGGGWVYNWHCVDHVGYNYNPRRRDIGYHAIFDHYAGKLQERDALHFHYHPVPFNRNAHHSATRYFAHNDTLFQILARRILERGWFPSVNRAGFHTERPDSHWFLEQYIPFDFSNQASLEDYRGQADLSNGRFGDWRRAPRTWEPYHPSHDDYQVPGSCRRWIARCLNVGMRVRILSQEDVDQAFREASEGCPVVLSFADLDYRDMRVDVNYVWGLLKIASEKYSVPFRYCEASEAMRRALSLVAKEPCGITLKREENVLSIRSDRPTFGPQPFFAMKTNSGEYYHDNLDTQKPFREWTYTFDEQTFPWRAIQKAGVGTSDSVGNTTVAVMGP